MTETKKLYRQDQGKIIFGVCAGLASYFDLDPIVIRAIFILLTFFHGAGILLYLTLFFLAPKQGKESTASEKEVEEKAEKLKEKAKHLSEKIRQKNFFKDTRRVLGVVCVLGGLGIILNRFFFDWFQWDIFWMVSLIVFGFYLVLTDNNVK